MKVLSQLKISIIILVISIQFTKAQNIVNPDLNGIMVYANTCMPTNWLQVPWWDIHCQSSTNGGCTPDLTTINAPDSVNGIRGNPYSGTSFVSALHAGPNGWWHEGIMQSDSGFIIGQVYEISFYQTVVKQINALDVSGSWAVYIDDSLAGITPPTHSSLPFNSTSLVWEPKLIVFTATNTDHWIKFLPMDDDTNRVSSLTDTTGALRMGIDLINITPHIPLGFKNQYNSIQASVFPNPFNQSTQIQFNNPKKEVCTLTLYNYNGKIVRTITNITTNNIILERNNLENGIYFFTIESRDKIFFRNKVTIN